MATLEKFFDEAERAFSHSGLRGEFHGLVMKKGLVYFIHSTPEHAVWHTQWMNAPATWEKVTRVTG